MELHIHVFRFLRTFLILPVFHSLSGYLVRGTPVTVLEYSVSTLAGYENKKSPALDAGIGKDLSEKIVLADDPQFSCLGSGLGPVFYA